MELRTARISIASLFAVLALANIVHAGMLTPPTYGSTYMGWPSVASNGHGFLTLWGGQAVFGSLADSHGNVLTPIPFPVMPSALVRGLFPYGGGYVAIVSRDTSDAIPRLAYLSAEGKLLRYGVSLPPQPQVTSVARAFNGEAFLTVPILSFVPGPIAADIVSIDGRVTRATIATDDRAYLYVTASGPDFVVVSIEPRGVFYQSFRSDGSVSCARVRVVQTGTSVYPAVIASSERETAVVWTEFVRDSTPLRTRVHIVTVAKDGSVIGRSDVEMQTSALQLVWTGSQYMLLLGTSVVAIQRDASVIATPVATVSQPVIQPEFAAATRDAVFTVELNYHFVTIGRAITIGPPPQAATPVVLSIDQRRQASPLAAFNGIDGLALWRESTAETSQLLAARIDNSGNAEGPPFQIDTPDTALDVHSGYGMHSIVFGFSVTLVVWENGPRIFARRVDRSGNLLDSDPIVLSTTGSMSRQPVVWDGTSFVVIFTDRNGTALLRVSEAGTVSELPRPVGPPVSYAPSIAWDGTRFLIVWPLAQYGPCPIATYCSPTPIGISLLRLSGSGVAVDPKPVDVMWATSGVFRIATSGTEFVIISEMVTEGRVVHADRAAIEVDDAIRLVTWPAAYSSNVIWNGREYVLAWQYGIGASWWAGTLRLDRRLSSIAPAGNIPIGRSDGSMSVPGLASNLRGDVITLTAEIPPDGNAMRIYTHRDSEVTPNPAPPPAPYITSAVGTAQSVSLTWQVAPWAAVSEFIIERGNPYTDAFARIAFASGDARSITIDTASFCYYCTRTARDLYVRMRSVNAAGISVPTAAVAIQPPARNRAVSR